MRVKRLPWMCAAAVFAGLMAPAASLAASFIEPPVFTSKKGVLDILMIAKAKPVTAISFKPPGGKRPINPTGWVYEICYRNPAINDRCPAAGKSTRPPSSAASGWPCSRATS